MGFSGMFAKIISLLGGPLVIALLGGGLVWWYLLVMLVCLFLFFPSQLPYRSHSSINKLLPQLYVTSSADQFGKG